MKNFIGMSLNELLTMKNDDVIFQVKEEKFSLPYKENKENIEKLLKMGVKSLKSKDYIEALTTFKAILIIAPSNIKAINNLAVTYYKMGRSKTAIEYLEKILILEPKNESAKENIKIMSSTDKGAE